MNLAPLRVALLAVPPVRELDLVGIVDVFVTANGFLPPERRYQLELVTSSVKPDIEGMCGLRFAGARHYSTLEGEIDTLLVPGVPPDKVQLSPTLLRWFRSRAKKCRRVGSICTGAYVMAQAGLLDGKRAATQEVRLDAVRRKLENSTRSLEEIAAACGFNSADVMSRSFRRHLKTTPAEYRARFRTSGVQHHESVRRTAKTTLRDCRNS